MLRAVSALVLAALTFCASPLEPEVPLAKRHHHGAVCAPYTGTVTPDTATIPADSALAVSMSITSPCGGEVPNIGVNWISRAPVVATVSDTGHTALVTGKAAGQAYIVGTSTSGGAIDSMLVTVTGATTCTSTATNLCPGDDLNAKVQAAGTNTRFTLGAGVYREQQITPKTGDSFDGAGMGQTILTGSRVLAGPWTQSGSNYYVGGQTQKNAYKNSWQCDATHPLCWLPEMLWVNNHLYIPVGTTGALGVGKWVLDTVAHRIYLPFNPTDSVVETSTVARAFAGSATGVTISDLTVQRYANSNGYGAIGYNSAGQSWTITRVRARENHGVGIKGFGRWTITASRADSNGQMGYACNGVAVLFDHDSIVGNNTNGNTGGPAGEAGGGKCVTTDSLLMQFNYAAHNHGPGLWTDINNIHTRYHKNVVDTNDWRGIFHEISYDAVIDSNTAIGNGKNLPFAQPAATDGAGIMVSNSPNVEVFGNFVQGNRAGITGLESDRGSGVPALSGGGGVSTPHNLTNLHVHNNTVVQTDAGKAGGTTDSDPSADPYSAAANNVWDHNDYTLGASTVFFWSGAGKTYSLWRGFGQDVGSTETGQ